MNAARDRIVSALPEEAGLIRCSAHTDDGVYELAVHFPDVFRHKYVDELARLETDIGWSLKIRDTPHQARLFEEALDCLPYFAEMTKAPALRIDRMVWERASRDAENRFKDVTGYTLVLADASGPRRSVESSSPKGAMEINKAYVVITAAFAGERHAPYRVVMKSDDERVYRGDFCQPEGRGAISFQTG
jgi:hypothetical protein